MIFALFLIALAVSATAFDVAGLKHPREYYEEKFVDFMKKFSIQARDGGHFLELLRKFADNTDFIEKHNASPEGKKFTMAMNRFGAMSYEEWVKHLNLGLARPAHTPAPQMHSAVNSTSIPDSIDWTTKGAVTDVKNQGQCGSCWSFSTTGALEGAYQIKYGTLESFSEQNLVSCDNFRNGGTDMGCNGGLMDNAFKWTQKNGGLCTEADYPYTSGTTMQNGNCEQSSCTLNSKVAPTTYTDVAESDADMMSALAQQPVSVAIQANQPAFQFYSGGVMTGTCGSSLDHGVLAVGYGTYTDGTDYYKVKNSWGPDWGMGGYILLARGSDYGKAGQCGILSGPPSYPTL
jgi:C1A family cysteine protease